MCPDAAKTLSPLRQQRRAPLPSWRGMAAVRIHLSAPPLRGVHLMTRMTRMT
jgi:hypothetical protein